MINSTSTDNGVATLPRGERRKQHTKRRLLDAAAVTYALFGVDGATISAITETADVGLGTFYLHFEDKDAIAIAVAAVMVNRILADEQRAIDEVRSVGGSPDPLGVLSHAVCQRAAESPGLLAALLRWQGSKSASQIGALPGTIQHALLPHMADLYRTGIGSGRYRIEDPELMAQAVFGVYCEVIPTWAHGLVGGDVAVEKLAAFVQRIVTAMCRA